jgi:hypothetical protein
MKHLQANHGGKAGKQHKDNDFTGHANQYCGKAASTSSSLSLAEITSGMDLVVRASSHQLQEAVARLARAQGQERDLQSNLTQKAMANVGLQALKQRLQDEQQGSIGPEPALQVCTQTGHISGDCPAEATVVVEVKIYCAAVEAPSTSCAPAPSSSSTLEGGPTVLLSHDRMASNDFCVDLREAGAEEAVPRKLVKKSDTFSKLKKPFRAAKQACLAAIGKVIKPKHSSIASLVKLDCLRPQVLV